MCIRQQLGDIERRLGVLESHHKTPNNSTDINAELDQIKLALFGLQRDKSNVVVD